MISSRLRARLRLAVPIGLLVMILMRLVWMQLRSYPPQADTRALMSLETLLTLPMGSTCDSTRSIYRQGLAPLQAGLAAQSPVEPGLKASRPQGASALHLAAARAYFASPGYVGLTFFACKYDLLDDRWAIKMNQWLLALTVLCVALMTRMVTSSWTVALASATVVFSRGRLLADIGLIAPDYIVMFWLSAGLMAGAHVLRTGSRAGLVAMALAFFAATLFERTLLVLFLVMPLLLLLGALARGVLTRSVIHHLRGSNRRLRAVRRSRGIAVGGGELGLDHQGAAGGGIFARFTHSIRDVLGLEFPLQDTVSWRLNYERGSLFRTIGLPFLVWAYWQRRWLRLSLAWLGAAALALVLLLVVQRLLGGPHGLTLLLANNLYTSAGVSPFGAWLLALLRQLDMHLAVSLGLLLCCAVQAPTWGLPSFFEWSWLLLLAIGLLLWSAFAADSIDFQLVYSLVGHGVSEPTLLHLLPRRLVLWLEPTILSCGVACVYNLMKVLDSRMTGR